MKKISLLVVLALATLSVGATQFTNLLNLNVKGKTLLGTGVETGNGITRSLGTSATIDFAVGTILCDLSTGITVTGAKVGDACDVGAPNTLGYDGGAGLNAVFSCYVSATNTVVVKHCPVGTPDDPPSATFYIRLTSAQ